MAIDDKSIKKLWGQAAGRCSYPGCPEECIKFFDDGGTVIGEMAHVIAKSKDGPRGIPEGGTDDYENLILLCPTHHRTIDKAPADTFPPELLHDWKRQHEARIDASIGRDANISFEEAIEEIDVLLDDNFEVWNQYGPSSDRAIQNPLSNIAELWAIRRVAQVVPNNARICTLLNSFITSFDRDDIKIIRAFKDHASGYQLHCYSPIEDYRQFPQEFREMIRSRWLSLTTGTSVTKR